MISLNSRICTLVILVVITIIGGIIVVVHPGTLTFHQYLSDLAVAWGLLGIGHGIDSASKP